MKSSCSSLTRNEGIPSEFYLALQPLALQRIVLPRDNFVSNTLACQDKKEFICFYFLDRWMKLELEGEIVWAKTLM